MTFPLDPAAPVPPDGENPIRDMNPYRYEGANLLSRAAWDSGYSVGFAAGRAAATPDPPDMTNMCEGESPDHKPGITPAASPDERLREALTRIERLVARWDAPIRHDVDDRVAYEKWAAVGSEAHKIAADALAAADREAPDEGKGQKITHGRHCICTPCAAEDWTNPALAPCGMHGSSCPREYQPWGAAGDPARPPVVPVDEPAIRADERERLSARVYENGWCPTCAHKADPDAMPPHEVAAILVDPAEVLSPEEVAEYERCQQSVIDARRRAPMVEGQMIVGAAASPDERLREALREIVAAFPSPPDREMDDEEIEKWYADHGDWFQRLAALAAADREAPDEETKR